jgi:23S rRNA (guanosine2251-2'-O)-methyltransferase
MKRGHRTGKPKGGFPRFYGRHAVTAALANPDRVVRKVWGTREALAALDLPPVLPIVYADVADLGRMVPADAPHQGIVAEVEALDDIWLGDLLEEGAPDEAVKRPILVLDHRHAGPPCPAGIRRARACGVGRARIHALGAGGEPGPRAR